MAPAARSTSPQSRETSGDPSGPLGPALDPVSDNETGEKSARDQLEKTSIDTLAQPAPDPTEHEILPRSAPNQQPVTVHSSSGPAPTQTQGESPRGRPVRKRSFDGSDVLDSQPNPSHHEDDTEASKGHLRKRSRDIRSGEGLKNGEKESTKVADPLEEEAEEIADDEPVDSSMNDRNTQDSNLETDEKQDTTSPIQVDDASIASLDDDKQDAERETSADPSTSHANQTGVDAHTEDEQMKDGSSSPRRKRSRNQLEADADREQKIAATEIARAQRRSDEISRTDMLSQSGESDQADAMRTSPRTSPAGKSDTKRSKEGKALPPSAFGEPAKLHTAQPTSSSRSTKEGGDTTSPPRAASASAFASSGFAALANSSASPFGTFGAAPNTSGAPIFGAPKSPPPTAPPSTIQNPKSGLATGSGSFSSASSSSNTAVASPFGAAAASTGGAFGRSVFGGGFGTGFGRGNKLSSFAAPTGDAKFGAMNGNVKPIGSPIDDEVQDDDAESGGEDAEGKSGDGENSESDDRFQQQDVETGEDGEESIFSTRASLYTFKDNTWKEAGKGVFKLNVLAASSDDTDSAEQTGRFIMRAHQTYRVLVNAPIFRQMKVGDSRGNEPSGKSFAFAVVEEGRPTPYMVKLGDVGESKDLYHKVQKLQRI